MSLAMLTYLISYLAIFGIVYHEDEGTPAHLFQIWMFLEFLMIVFFAFKWLPREPKQALKILALQIIVALATMAPVFYFKL